MKNVMSLYVDTSEGSTEELNRLISEIEQSIHEGVDEEVLERLREEYPKFKRYERFLTLPVLEHVTGYSKERISAFRNGRQDVPYHLILHLRLLHDRATRQPSLAQEAIEDWLERHG